MRLWQKNTNKQNQNQTTEARTNKQTNQNQTKKPQSKNAPSLARDIQGAHSYKQRQNWTLHQELNLRDWSHVTTSLKWGSPAKRLKLSALQNSIIWDTMY